MNNNEIDDWQLVLVNSEVQKPLVTIRIRTIAFNAYFVKVAGLEKKSRVSIKVKPNLMQLGFKFHDDSNIRDSFTLTKDGGGSNRAGKSRAIQAQKIFKLYPWLNAVTNLDPRSRQFEPTWVGIDSLWVISLCPPFENRVSDRSEIPHDIKGVYRYKLGDEIVYIGRGTVKSRAQSPERIEWNFETIEYSIIPEEDGQKKWEAFWLDRYVEQEGKLPFYNRISGEKSKLST
jgi:hypothetical protein